MNAEQIELLNSFLKQKFNYDFSNYALSSYERRIDRYLILRKIDNITALMAYLEASKANLDDFIEEITVNTTEMFRDPTVWLSLRNNILPALNKNQNIRIWHAGCSSGEEVASMLILLKELGMLEKSKLYATDLSAQMLNHAKEAKFREKNMELNRENYYKAGGSNNFNDFFDYKNEFYNLDKSLIEYVTFKRHNLVSDAAFTKFDLILCRNVMIYFNKDLQDVVIEKFSQSLFKNAFLAIGKKESLIFCKHVDLFSVVDEENKIYKMDRKA